MLGFFFSNVEVNAQFKSSGLPIDSLALVDSSAAVVDSLALSDSLVVERDTMISKEAITSKVSYTAKDSMIFDVKTQKVYLYGQAEINYEAIKLKAEYVEINWENKILFAEGAPDSSGAIVGRPVFTEGESEFKAESIRYNFETKKGKITQVLTKQDESYIHGAVVKKDSSDTYFIQGGKYTTCSLDTPHFHIASSKMKVIKDSKIIVGPSNMVIEEMDTPLAIPFGIFPNKKGQSSGIRPPRYGNDNRGFFLAEGGYYFGLSDYVDLELLGTIYTKGDYALIANSNYANRYRYNGNVSVTYAYRKDGEPELPETYSESKDYLLKWVHRQDQKARPGSLFSADVTAGTSSYYTKNLQTSVQDALTNQYSSSISWTKNFKTSSFSLNGRHYQNTLNKTIDISFPEGAYNVQRFYPFKAGKQVGKDEWYEKIGISYSNDFKNSISTYDTLFPNHTSLSDFSQGMRHVVPITTSFRIFKYFMISPSASYNERWVLQSIEKTWDSDSLRVNTLTNKGFKSNRDFITGISASTEIFGMYQLKNLPVKAVRHKLTPTIGYIWRPDFSDRGWGGGNSFGTYQADSAATQFNSYSYFDNGLYDGPLSGKFSTVTLRLANSLEMKTRNRKDTVTGEKKITLFQPLDISSGYNLALDSNQLQPIIISAGTVISQKLNLNMGAQYNAYDYDNTGRKNRYFLYDRTGKIANLENANSSLSFNLSNADFRNKKDSVGNLITNNDRLKKAGYSNFDIDWNASISYNIYYNKNYNRSVKVDEVTQTIGLSGSLEPTPFWRISYYSGFDLMKKKMTPTTFTIWRDLHCWQMELTCVPFGSRQSYYFTLKAKSTILQDLKLEKKKDAYNAD